MARVGLDAVLHRERGAVGDSLQLGGALLPLGMGVAAGVELDDRRAEADRRRDLALGRLDEQADPDVRAAEPVHGKASLLDHDGAGPFAGLAEPIRVGRYHSLCTRDVPDRFRVHARIDGMAMAISDAGALQSGVQFHPESILTPAGARILANLVGMGKATTA